MAIKREGAHVDGLRVIRSNRSNAIERSTPAPKPTDMRRRGIDRGIEVLNYLYDRGEPLRRNQIALGVGAPRSTVYEIVDRLLDAGFLQKFDQEGRVFLGRRLHYLGISYIRHFGLTREAEHILRDLTAQTNETSELCMLEGRKYIVALMRVGGSPFRITVDVGQQLPIPWTASGALLVSDMSESEILRFIPELDFVLPDGRRLDRALFLRRVQEARRRGLSRLDGQVDSFTHCMAAPVLDMDSRCVATLCLVVPRVDATKRGNELSAALVEAAVQLSERIGGGLIKKSKPRSIFVGRE
jgi:DNA-binding IclR family transcriptional regulator